VPRLNHPPTQELRRASWLFNWAETIVVALVLALVIRAFFLQVFWIPSGSMEPTFDIGDRIVVDKVSYHFREPRRLEVVVFRGVPAMSEQKKDLIKRLVGLPGEKLEIKDGRIHINGQPLAEKHAMNEDFANFGPVTIPADSYFVMGDNRPASADSRYWGFLPKRNLIGPAFLRIWPLVKLSLIGPE
jgi:signal peptidase I